MNTHARSTTPGYKAILVSDEAFAAIKAIQLSSDDQKLPVRFDLKDIATAFVLEALNVPNIREKSRMRAFAVITQTLNQLEEKS